MALLYVGVLALWLGPAQCWPRLAFYLLFGITVTASVQLVGVLLVFANLIAPAIATRSFHGVRRIVIADIVGGAGAEVFPRQRRGVDWSRRSSAVVLPAFS